MQTIKEIVNRIPADATFSVNGETKNLRTFCRKNPNRLSQGNGKLSQKIGIFSLPPGSTCPNGAICRGCYAAKFYNLRPSCRISWEANRVLASLYPDVLRALIARQIKTQRIHYVRIHGSGDFFSQDYVYDWKILAERFPSVNFWFYTKFQDGRTDNLTDLPNVNRVESILPCGTFNYGDHQTVVKLAKKYHAPICPATTKKGKGIVCGKHCKACMHNQYVLFHQH